MRKLSHVLYKALSSSYRNGGRLKYMIYEGQRGIMLLTSLEGRDLLKNALKANNE